MKDKIGKSGNMFNMEMHGCNYDNKVIDSLTIYLLSFASELVENLEEMLLVTTYMS